MPGPSSSFTSENRQLARLPRVVVGFHPPGKSDIGDMDPVFASGWGWFDEEGGPFKGLVGISPLASSFDLSSLSFRVGDMTATILAQGPMAFPQIMGQGAEDPRAMTILLGFGRMELHEYLRVFSGHVTALPKMGGDTYQIRSTDGMDLLRRLDRGALESDPWAFPYGLALSRKGGLQVGMMVNDLLLASSNGLKGLSEDDFSLWSPIAQVPLYVDGQLLQWALETKVLEQASDAKSLTESILPPFGVFMSRSVDGDYRLSVLQRRDSRGSDAPSWHPEPVLLSDDDIVSIKTGWDSSSGIRSVQFNYGLQVWDSIDDLSQNFPQEAAAAFVFGYEGTELGNYQLSHRFEVVPHTADSRRGTRVDGRDVAIDAPAWFCTQSDKSDEAIWKESSQAGKDDIEIGTGDAWGEFVNKMSLYRPGGKIDQFGFPVRYACFRRSWLAPTWTVGLPGDLPGAENDYARNSNHSFHNYIGFMAGSAARILRSGFLPALKVDMSLQARSGATIRVGDLVNIDSKHAPDMATRSMGTDASLPAQVVSCRSNPMNGKVDISAMLPMGQPEGWDSPFWAFEDEVCHDSNDSNGWGAGDNPALRGEGDSRWGMLRTNPELERTRNFPNRYNDYESRGVLYWLYTTDLSDPDNAVVTPRASACESYAGETDKHAFHYIEFDGKVDIELDVIDWEDGFEPYVASVRFSALSGDGPLKNGINSGLQVEWSEVVRFYFRPRIFGGPNWGAPGIWESDGKGYIPFKYSMVCPQANGPKPTVPDDVEMEKLAGWEDGVQPEHLGDDTFTYEATPYYDFVDAGISVGDEVTIYWNTTPGGHDGGVVILQYSITGVIVEIGTDGKSNKITFVSAGGSARWSELGREDRLPDGSLSQRGHSGIWNITIAPSISDTAGSDRPFINNYKMFTGQDELAGIQAVKVDFLGIEKITPQGQTSNAPEFYKGDSRAFVSFSGGNRGIRFRRLKFAPASTGEDDGSGRPLGGEALEAIEETEQL